MDELSDKEIIEKIRNGEIDYFEIFVKKYSKIVFYYTKKKVKSEADTEDIVQNAFIKIYKSLDRFDINQAFYPYFFTIVKNEINEFFRKNKKILPLHEEIAAPELEDEFGFELLIHDLRPEYKRVLELYFREGYSYKEIGEKLKKPINTVKTLIRRAKEEVKITI